MEKGGLQRATSPPARSSNTASFARSGRTKLTQTQPRPNPASPTFSPFAPSGSKTHQRAEEAAAEGRFRRRRRLLRPATPLEVRSGRMLLLCSSFFSVSFFSPALASNPNPSFRRLPLEVRAGRATMKRKRGDPGGSSRKKPPQPEPPQHEPPQHAAPQPEPPHHVAPQPEPASRAVSSSSSGLF